MLAYAAQQNVQIGKKAFSKFWDRQTSLEREDLEFGASLTQTNHEVLNAAQTEHDAADNALNINSNNVCTFNG